MTVTLLEKLPSGQNLFSINMETNLNPGQWITQQKSNFPVFKSADGKVYFVGDEGTEYLNNFSISGVPIEFSTKLDQIIILAQDGGVVQLFSLIHHLRDVWGLKQLRSKLNLVLLGTDNHFPFTPVPSNFIVPGLPFEAIGTSPYLEDLKIPARLAHTDPWPGCYQGKVTDLLKTYLKESNRSTKNFITIGSEEFNLDIKKLLNSSSVKQLMISAEFN